MPRAPACDHTSHNRHSGGARRWRSADRVSHVTVGRFVRDLAARCTGIKGFSNVCTELKIVLRWGGHHSSRLRITISITSYKIKQDILERLETGLSCFQNQQRCWGGTATLLMVGNKVRCTVIPKEHAKEPCRETYMPQHRIAADVVVDASIESSRPAAVSSTRVPERFRNLAGSLSFFEKRLPNLRHGHRRQREAPERAHSAIRDVGDGRQGQRQVAGGVGQCC